MPRVNVAVHAGGDHLEVAAVAVEVGEHRRADEAVLRAVAVAAAHVLERLERLARVVDVRLALEAQRAVGVPDVDLAVHVGHGDLGQAVAVEVGGGRRGEDRGVRGARVDLAAR